MTLMRWLCVGGEGRRIAGAAPWQEVINAGICVLGNATQPMAQV
jgi:hypothetical protein